MKQILIRMDCWLSSAQNEWLEAYSKEKTLKKSGLMRLVIDMFLDKTNNVSRTELEEQTVKQAIRVTEAQYRKLQILSRDNAVAVQSILRQATQYYMECLRGMESMASAPTNAQKLRDIVAANPAVPGGQRLVGYSRPKKVRIPGPGQEIEFNAEEEVANLEKQKEIRDNQLDQFSEQVQEILGFDATSLPLTESGQARDIDPGFIQQLITILSGPGNDESADLKKELEKILDNGSITR